jgi:hypothetical protein
MFVARHESASHRIEIPLPVEDCFSLFTPEGERLWIAEWQPHYFHPANGETLAGMVFMTGHGNETSYWTLVDHDRERHYIRYARVTPGSRSVLVAVTCAVNSEKSTLVDVCYMSTGLTEAGNAEIDAYAGEAYIAMIEDWRVKILKYIARNPRLITMQ